ncbi:hypothetical protein DSO57_1008368 [Entomophthora muscae]|uniref:Uncharacterized protein n=1 Tax=Entomophthora muscae TaxID=34485 RepID=A0ACC2RY93_9FUNG|nr:hypothetical protein DSO57_1008368 [Entomophthora muscae]
MNLKAIYLAITLASGAALNKPSPASFKHQDVSRPKPHPIHTKTPSLDSPKFLRKSPHSDKDNRKLYPKPGRAPRRCPLWEGCIGYGSHEKA